MCVLGGGGGAGGGGVTRDHCLYSDTTILTILLYSDTTVLTILLYSDTTVLTILLYSDTTVLTILLYSDTTVLTILRWSYYRKVPQRHLRVIYTSTLSYYRKVPQRHLRVIYTSTSIICGWALPPQKSEMNRATNCLRFSLQSLGSIRTLLLCSVRT